MRHSIRLGSVLAGVIVTLAHGLAFAAPANVLESEIAHLAKGAGGMVGVAAWRLDGKGPRVTLNGNEPFPMASTFKIAVAGAVLAAVDAGRATLDQMITVEPAMHVPSEVIADRFLHPGVSLSVLNLLDLMLTQSDNTATDVLMQLAGGAQAVTNWVKAQGVREQRIDRDTAGLIRAFFHLPPGPVMHAIAAAPGVKALSGKPQPSFDDDPRDSSTPEAMAQLLTQIFKGEALSQSSTHTLIAIMERCRTGEARLKGRMPAGTVVAHKTGTIGGTVNDVGVIQLPDDRGQVVIAVFVKKSDMPVPERERAIAEIARSVRDFFLFGST